MRRQIKRAFTLIEVLVAGSILFIVSAAVVGLSNSIIQGTALTTDETVANRLSTAGLEIVTKIRDDKIKNASYDLPGQTGEFVWFDQAESSSNYGWYALSEPTTNSWTLGTKLSQLSNTIPLEDTTTITALLASAQKQTVGIIDFYQLICVEAVAGTDNQDDQELNCNTRSDTSQIINDGDRSSAVQNNDCFSGSGTGYEEDLYCQFTKDSINRNRIVVVGTNDKIVSDGNAVKVRSVVLWNDKGTYRTVSTATLFTNWQSVAD